MDIKNIKHKMDLQQLHAEAERQYSDSPWIVDRQALRQGSPSNWVLCIRVDTVQKKPTDALVVVQPIFPTPEGDIAIRGYATQATLDVRRAVGGGGQEALGRWLGPKIAHEALPDLPVRLTINGKKVLDNQ